MFTTVPFVRRRDRKIRPPVMVTMEQLSHAPPQSIIKDVWASNLEEEMRSLRDTITHCTYISMDTEFPGVVARPIGEFHNQMDYYYQTMRCNVDLCCIIQLGITLTNDNGELPARCFTWQFNFKFNLEEDMFAQDSIDLLQRSGINFQKNLELGIDPNDFAELLITSGVVLSNKVTWVVFQGGYDFGYLLKILTCAPLPEDEEGFFDLISYYFPNLYDIKYLMRSCKKLKGGLSDLGDELEVKRIGPQHQAGSDSLLTAGTFFTLRDTYFENEIDENKYLNIIHGL